ncbi:MAG TPA: hypothetical protein VG326_04265 [Tepidisphaeraceae bacterium]|nr:hypothetical protein [Tepidisphaeraceae bacterium]
MGIDVVNTLPHDSFGQKNEMAPHCAHGSPNSGNAALQLEQMSVAVFMRPKSLRRLRKKHDVKIAFECPIKIPIRDHHERGDIFCQSRVREAAYAHLGALKEGVFAK